jgi:hypothetical protein
VALVKEIVLVGEHEDGPHMRTPSFVW